MSVAVFTVGLLRFTAAGSKATTVVFSDSNAARTSETIQTALRARQTGPGTITVTDHADTNTHTVTVALPAGVQRPARGSTDLWEWDDGHRIYRSGPLAWEWIRADTDAPSIAVDVAFGHGAKVFPAQGFGPGWGHGLSADLDEPITGYRISRLNPVRQGRVTRGRPHQLATAQAATAHLWLDDSNGHLDPDNPDAPSPYRDADGEAALSPGRPIRVIVTPPGGDAVTVFVGIIERVLQDYPGQTDERVKIECVDAWKLLVQGSADADQPATTTLEGAFETICANGGLPAVKSASSPYSVEDAVVSRLGDSVAISSYELDAGTRTASEVRDLERSTGAQLRIGRDGVAETIMPSTFLVLPDSYVEVNDGTAVSGVAGGLRYSGVDFARDDDRIINRVQVGSRNLLGDTAAIITNSRDVFGTRVHQVTDSLLGDTEQRTWAVGLVKRWSQPVTRLRTLELKPRQLPVLWPDVLAADVADAWRVTRTSPAGAVRRVPVLLERVHHTFTPAEWTTRLSGTSVNPLKGDIPLFGLGEGGTEYVLGEYKHRVFVDSASVMATGAGQVQFVVIGGGGSGGGRGVNGNGSGGGGAGGVVLSEAVDIGEGATITITVGDGRGASSTGNGINGGDSVVVVGSTTVTAIGGGGGGANGSSGPAGDGGSGGGAGSSGGRRGSRTGSGTDGQGHDGGNAYIFRSADGTGGGGGGATAAGRNATSTTPGTGGAGRQLNLTGSTVRYATGGGGRRGGSSGGGARADTAGSGGGGGSRSSTGSNSFGNTAGRDGLVVIRWRDDSANLVSVGDLIT